MKINIWADGSIHPNPGGIGGWACVAVLPSGEIKELSGSESVSTNNRMELKSCIESIKWAFSDLECSSLNLYSDSAYVVNCFLQKWYIKWRSNGWINSKRKPVENKDLFEELINLYENYEVNFIKTRGHHNDELNNRCDKLANAARISHCK